MNGLQEMAGTAKTLRRDEAASRLCRDPSFLTHCGMGKVALTVDIQWRKIESMRAEGTTSRRHSEPVLMRFEPEQLRLIAAAAAQAGLNRTAWIRTTLLRAARTELAQPVASDDTSH